MDKQIPHSAHGSVQCLLSTMNDPNPQIMDMLKQAWFELGLPSDALTESSIDLSKSTGYYPSSFRVGDLAQMAVALSALTAAYFWSVRHDCVMRKVSVAYDHACVEFKSERLYVLDGKPAPTSWGTIGGLHKTEDGYVRMHDSFPNHRKNALKILGLSTDASREEVAEKILQWKSVALESEAFRQGAVIAALRTPEAWQELPQAKALPKFPIKLERLATSSPYVHPLSSSIIHSKCLRGVRVIEMSRVVAAPVAGRTLAAHGADVIWITSPTLPDLPELDIDLSRGKRTVQLDIRNRADKAKLLELLQSADIFIQSYRPGSLAAQGLGAAELIKTNPNLIIANLNAYGTEGPWAENRGFDSLVQTCSGINVAEARAFGADEPARVLPCQALDHGAGYFLASGIMAALSKRAIHGGSYRVHVSLAGVMNYLKLLGRYPGKSGFERNDFKESEDIDQYLEARQTGLGVLKAVRHSAKIEGIEVGWEEMPKALGSDSPVWI